MRLTIQSASALRTVCLMLIWREETDLLHSRSRDEHAEIVRPGIGRLKEKSFTLCPITLRRSDNDLVVPKRHFHPVAIWRFGEERVFHSRRITREITNEEQRFQVREKNDCRFTVSQIGRDVQVRLGWIEVVRIAAHDTSILESCDNFPPVDCRMRDGHRKLGCLRCELHGQFRNLGLIKQSLWNGPATEVGA